MNRRAITIGTLTILGLLFLLPGTAFRLPAASAQAAPSSAAATYERLTAREWAQIAKDPDAHSGERYVVYGVVTQFDAMTGSETFRADVDGVRHVESYEYPTNTILTGDAAQLERFIVGDTFEAKVEMNGSLTYETQVGGSLTVPQLHVDSMEMTSAATQ
ncbi:hypothetical protein [Streptomyces sp. 4F14]|uniref:hypothetical protein n=1 Tax=Streptomyces sp. 4F14 TaxID=3394380 RepID=UPI003A8C30F3